MGWNKKTEFGEIVLKYRSLEKGELLPSLDQDFNIALGIAPRKLLAPALAVAFRSPETPSFPEMVATLYQFSKERRFRAELLNLILTSVPDPPIENAFFKKLKSARIAPEDTDKFSGEMVAKIALDASLLKPEVVDAVSTYCATHRRSPLVALDKVSRSLVLTNLASVPPSLGLEASLKQTAWSDTILKAVEQASKIDIEGKKVKSDVPPVLSTPAKPPAAEYTFKERYPAMSFYDVAVDAEVPIQDTNTLSPPQEGHRLEFHFWIDVDKLGIHPTGEWPNIEKPDHVPYPLIFQVTVWSEDFNFSKRDGEVTLKAEGRTEHAKFPIHGSLKVSSKAELFVFLRYAETQTLVGAFRIKAPVTQQIEKREHAITWEPAFLLKDWFRFRQHPSRTELTIFITKKEEALQMFALSEGDPWAELGPTTTGLYQYTGEIYKEIYSLSKRAEHAVENKDEFKFFETKHLAELGYALFGQLFLEGKTTTAHLAKNYFRDAPEGSVLTIAIGHEAEDLYIPWGLLYVKRLPEGVASDPDRSNFLGCRYNLVVRPSMTFCSETGKGELPVHMGAAWSEHQETPALREFFQQHEVAKKLIIEPISAEEGSLPALAKNQYDLIEFFCHAETKLPGVCPDGELPDSTLQLNELVTLASLADVLDQPMAGYPIILLSMCDSAQVSAAGTGFVPFFLQRGARAVVGTEGPTLWKLSREMDTQIVKRLLDCQTISEAFYETRKELVKTNPLALIYSLYGDGGAKLVQTTI